MSAASNLQATLDTIAACEGTASGDGYRALFGYTPNNGKVFDGYVTHPNKKFPFVQQDGQLNYTTAAGRYQIIYPTFQRLQIKLKTVDFTPETQDKMAAELIAERGAMNDVKNGNLRSAIDKCATIWASLPASTYLQPKRTYAFALAAYLDAGGELSN